MTISEENVNFSRLSHVIALHGGKALQETLKYVMDKNIPGTTLSQLIAHPRVINDLRRASLYPSQQELLYPGGNPSTTVTLRDIDISLAALLLKNITIFGASISQPRSCSPTLWKNPTDAERASHPIETSIVTIQNKRNDNFHRGSPAISNSEFEVQFDEVKIAILDLLKGIGHNTATSESEIEEPRKHSMSTHAVENIIRTFQQNKQIMKLEEANIKLKETIESLEVNLMAKMDMLITQKNVKPRNAIYLNKWTFRIVVAMTSAFVLFLVLVIVFHCLFSHNLYNNWRKEKEQPSTSAPSKMDRGSKSYNSIVDMSMQRKRMLPRKRILPVSQVNTPDHEGTEGKQVNTPHHGGDIKPKKQISRVKLSRDIGNHGHAEDSMLPEDVAIDNLAKSATDVPKRSITTSFVVMTTPKQTTKRVTKSNAVEVVCLGNKECKDLVSKLRMKFQEFDIKIKLHRLIANTASTATTGLIKLEERYKEIGTLWRQCLIESTDQRTLEGSIERLKRLPSMLDDLIQALGALDKNLDGRVVVSVSEKEEQGAIRDTFRPALSKNMDRRVAASDEKEEGEPFRPKATAAELPSPSIRLETMKECKQLQNQNAMLANNLRQWKSGDLPKDSSEALSHLQNRVDEFQELLISHLSPDRELAALTLESDLKMLNDLRRKFNNLMEDFDTFKREANQRAVSTASKKPSGAVARRRSGWKKRYGL